MTESKICTCPSGDGSLRHPCPAHPASVEQAGGDERAAFRPAQVISYRPGMGEVTIYVAGRVPGYMNIGDTVYVSDRAPVEQPSAALAQPSPVSEALIYACKNLAQITSSDGSGHADIAMAVLRMAGVGDDERERVVNEWKAARAWKPSPGQAEKAEAERPEAVVYRYRCTNFNGEPLPGWSYSDDAGALGLREPLMTFAQHERIVKAWIERWKAYIELSAKIAAQRDAANARLHEVATACATAEQERGAALARVAELERGKVYVEARRCDECQHGGINDSATGVAACHECDWTGPEPEEDKCPGCQRENCMAAACPQCGARYVLVASEEIAAPVAQAQHSVPEGWKLVPMDKGCVTSSMKAECIGEFSFYIRAACAECLDAGTDSDCHVCGGDIEYDQKIDVPWDTCKEIYKAMLAAAPGKVVGHE
ncbi:hypothetical protein IDX03_01675 [Pseudomonas aeruginosa]|uniref:hypothetical protein n=1 Tax=Pseudomonas aeruginosa TaxID=287 RepID=UPI00167FBDBC|nr:hypothetical protein [Pseudomonas aeruginosa]MBD1288782.1 hypothetical protein [Pseudomonas aeruginosa]HCF6212358.1 hypothetical protein [Pseudomonas aeruginosa]